MGKTTKYLIPKGLDKVKTNHPKLSSHATFRCKRKPNSPLCTVGFTKKTLTNRVLKTMSKKALLEVLGINPVKVNRCLARRVSQSLSAKYAEDKAVHNLEERINDFGG
jgi:hypothetical protein